MSSTRRTAFARTPRGNPQGGYTPATTQVNKQFLDRMIEARLAPDMATILTKTSAELNITVQPNGKGNFTINSGGRVIGDSSDVQKVQSLGSFINDERKAIVKTSVSAMAKKTVAAIVLVSRDKAFEDQVPRPITRVDKAFVDIFRTVNSQADMLNVNLQLINQTVATGQANEMVRNHLIESGQRIREALGSYLLYRGGIADGEEPLKLNSFLERGKVMSWIFSRLCSQKLQLGGKDFEFRKVYFPKDPTKGLQITFKELKVDALRKSQGGILYNMSVFRGLWSDEVVRPTCGIPGSWDLATFEGAAKPLANAPFAVVPSQGCTTLEEHFSVLAQHGDRGLPWNVGNTITPQDTLKFLGTVPKRIAYGFLGRPRFSAPFYENLFSGFQFDPSVIEREGRSVFHQLMAQYRAGTIRTEYFSLIKGELGYARVRAVLPPLILAVMDMPTGNKLSEQVLSSLDTDMSAIPNGETQAIQDSWAAITSRRNMSDEACDSALNGVLSVNLDPRSKDAKIGDIRMARCQISPEGTRVIREFKRRGYIALAGRIDQWMRSFLTAELQAAVADVIGARLEASLATPIQFGRGDTAVHLESAEFAQDEEVPEDDDEGNESEGSASNPDDN